MEKLFYRFMFSFLVEIGVDPNQVVSAFVEAQGLKGKRQERDLRDKLIAAGMPVNQLGTVVAAPVPRRGDEQSAASPEEEEKPVINGDLTITLDGV